MFRAPIEGRSRLRTGFEVLEVLYHATVRRVRGNDSNAVRGMVMNVVQSVIMLVMFIFIFDVLGLKALKVRGDFVLYVMSGVFLFMTHIKAMGAVAGAESTTSAMMMHAPMNPIIATVSAAIASLYQQFFAASVILFLYHAVVRPVTIEDPVGLMGMFLLAWASGAGVGLLFYAAKPWHPGFVALILMIYQRANMIASGKMVVANMAPARVRALFDWNPLYHTIDQGRGYAFINYTPRYTSVEYALWVLVACVIIGLMAQFFTRRYASASWGKR